MGFTPLEGLVMATRPGDVDAGVLVWALDHGVSPGELSDVLEHRCGLVGLAGPGSDDVAALVGRRASGDNAAGLALAVYTHRLRAKIAAMAAAAGGLDTLVFTGGVGEHSAPVRSETCARLTWAGVALDEEANAALGADAPGGAAPVSELTAPGARARTLVIPAREDLQIAAECRPVLGWADRATTR